MLFVFLSILLVMVLLAWLGYYLLRQPSEKTQDNNDNVIFSELQHIDQLKIDSVNSRLLYRSSIGAGLLLFGYYGLLGMLMVLVDYITGSYHAHFDLDVLPGVYLFGIVAGIFYFILGFQMRWYYTMFKHGMAPHLQHGQDILCYVKSLAKRLFRWHFYLYIALYILLTLTTGYGVWSMLATTFIYLFFLSFYIHMEMVRIGVPNLFEGFKNLIKVNKTVG